MAGGGLKPAWLRSLNPERIRVPVILPAQLGEENISPRPGVAQIERHGQLGLIPHKRGISSGIGDTVRAFATRYDDDGIGPPSLKRGRIRLTCNKASGRRSGGLGGCSSAPR